MGKLVILRGNSGSGKSTTAKTLQRALGRNTMLLSQDVIRREMLWVRDGCGNPAVSLLAALLQYGSVHSPYVILEGILDSEVYRPVFEAAKEAFGEEIYAYYYDLPFEETLRRHATKPNHMDFGEADMREWWKEKDLIGLIPETVFTKDVSAEEAITAILSHLSQS